MKFKKNILSATDALSIKRYQKEMSIARKRILKDRRVFKNRSGNHRIFNRRQGFAGVIYPWCRQRA